MNKVTKILAIGTFLVAAGGVGLVARAETTAPATTAQPAQGCPGGGMTGGGMMGRHDGRHAFGFGDPAARLAALKTDLGIKPEQAAAWDAYAKVVQDTAQQMQATRQGIDMNAVRDMSPQDRQAFMSKLHDQREQAFGAVRTAAQTLLPSLDDAQKTKAFGELPGLAAHGPHMRHAGMGWMGGAGAPGGQR